MTLMYENYDNTCKSKMNFLGESFQKLYHYRQRDATRECEGGKMQRVTMDDCAILKIYELCL